jgi:hypothetical protein
MNVPFALFLPARPGEAKERQAVRVPRCLCDRDCATRRRRNEGRKAWSRSSPNDSQALDRTRRVGKSADSAQRPHLPARLKQASAPEEKLAVLRLRLLLENPIL